jgi:hypothetical protein
VNPKTNGDLSWRSVHSYETDLEDAMERWKNKLYEVLTMICTQITKMMCDIGLGFYDLP